MNTLQQEPITAGKQQLMKDSWALPIGIRDITRGTKAARESALLDHNNEPYPDDTNRGIDHTSPTGTMGAFDPYTGAFGTAGTPMTCGYGMSGSTIGIGHAAGRAEWESDAWSGATPGTYAYTHGGRNRPTASQPKQEALTLASVPASMSADLNRGSLLSRLLKGLRVASA